MTEIEKLKSELEYKNGHLYWKVTRSPHARKGNRVGFLRKDGYYGFQFHKKPYLVHRVIFAITYDYFPEVIDHIDRDRSNNLLSNLREATDSQNAHNSGKSVNNKTGVKGIRVVRNGKYEARLALNGKTFQVGTFDNLSEAKERLDEYREILHKDFSCKG